MFTPREDENRRLLRARDAIDRAYAEPLDVATLARVALTSPAHFTRWFRAVFGETPHRYLQRRRIERACALLRTTATPITEIAGAVGYESLGTFSRTFAGIIGCSPSVYRARTGPIDAPSCFVRRWTRPAETGDPLPSTEGFGRSSSFARSVGGPGGRNVDRMINGISIHAMYVLDRDVALDFYVGTLGFVVDTDVDMGFMRWLTIAPPSQPDRLIPMERPGPPALSEDTAARIRELVTLGAMPATILSTDDCRATHADLRAKGVEFTQDPEEQPYGIDCAFRDPFGNHLRMTQRLDDREITDDDIARWSPDSCSRGSAQDT